MREASYIPCYGSDMAAEVETSSEVQAKMCTYPDCLMTDDKCYGTCDTRSENQRRFDREKHHVMALAVTDKKAHWERVKHISNFVDDGRTKKAPKVQPEIIGMPPMLPT